MLTTLFAEEGEGEPAARRARRSSWDDDEE
jgi:hypothetical protein